MLIWIIVAIIVIVAVILLIAAMRPNDFAISRQATIAAAPEKVFALINDFHEWPKWSPWEKLDPSMTRNLSGSASGKGALYEWRGNKKVGQGRMEITGSTPPLQVDIDLQFMAPWQAHNQTQFLLTPAATGTTVNWTMRGTSPFMFKLMGLFCNVDRMVGKDFEKGLANMKELAEAGA